MTNNVNNGGWNHPDAEKRREAFRLRLLQNPMRGGRPKGSKNKKPYPKSEAVLMKFEKHPPPSWAGKNHKMSTKEKMSEKRTLHIQEHGLQMSYKGRYSPKNPQKYAGNVSNIVYRSLWERNLMVRFDTDDQIVQWSSEELAIDYISPKDNMRHLYFPDFIIKAKQPDGTHVVRIIEVKPAVQCKEPVKKKKITKRYINEVVTWGVNQAKWKAATEYALDRGWQFKVITEHDIFPKGRA